MWSLLKELVGFAAREKRWWLVPLAVVLVVATLIVLFVTGSGISWALYPSR
jgi:hypothetical protein